ncbi:unnamed protein product [Polarella glacialis]|uniref:VTT domain-containing protein n=1 Tax=Polarella glacialis TaxID=89957 RepID=A0A813D731_POLGL|nr:unnamed protein product [Polarella glacialis]
MFAGALRLLMAPLRTVLGGRSSNLQDVGPDVAMLVPMAKQQRDNEEGVEGTMPHRAVQLSPEAAKGTLRLGFQWRGHAEMDLICLAMQADGKLSSHVWEGNRGCLQSMGIHFQPCNPASPDADDEDDDENDRAEAGMQIMLIEDGQSHLNLAKNPRMNAKLEKRLQEGGLKHTSCRRRVARVVRWAVAVALLGAVVQNVPRRWGVAFCSRPQLRLAHNQLQTRAVPADQNSGESLGPGESFEKWRSETADFWNALELWNSPIEDDNAEEAVALKEQTKLIEDRQQEFDAKVEKKAYLKGKLDQELGNELNKMPLLVFAYYKMRVTRVLDKDVVKKGFVSFLSYSNFVFVIVFFRTVVPRLLAVETMDDLFGVASDLGVPSRTNLLAGLQKLQEYDLAPKIGLYTAAFILEKLTLVSEILPVQIGLKTIAPIIFGGLVPGALISATCETIGAVVNFFIGRVLLTQRLRDFSVFGSEPIKDKPWFGKVERAAENDGFRLVLLLRLAHVLPLPFDSYWYILGALPVKLPDFVAAHWLGCLKTAFLDASLGLLLLTSASATLQGGEGKQQIVVFETVALAVVALLVSTFATRLATDLLGLEDGAGEAATSTEATDTLSSEQPSAGSIFATLSTSNVNLPPASEEKGQKVGPTIALQLQNVPDSTFACVFALVARGETGSWTSLAAFLKVQEATMTLAQHGKDQPFWRYNQTSAKEVANVWVSSCLYRGPHGSWRLEPLNMKLMMMEIDDPAVAYDDAAAEAARATAWQLRWLMKDRCWNSASEERRLRNPGHRGA